MSYIGLTDKQLFDAIQVEVAAGNVRENRHGDLVLYKYTETCAHERLWNKINRLCRGVIFDVSDDEPVLIANPFPKFFNLGEMKETMYAKLPNEPFEVFEKLDGSCGTAYFHKGKWRIATPGSLTSDQAIRATEMLELYDMTRFDPATDTPIFEIIYPENRIVVDYKDRDELVLLAVFGPDYEWSQDSVDHVAIEVGCERPRRYPHGDLASMPFEDNHEGYVIRFQSGLRVKVKSPAYVRIHRLLEYVSPKRVLGLIRGPNEFEVYYDRDGEVCEPETVESVSAALPSGLRVEFDDIRGMLTSRHEKMLFEADSYHSKVEDLDFIETDEAGLRKSRAIWINDNVPGPLRGLVFNLLDCKNIDQAAWKIVGRELQQ